MVGVDGPLSEVATLDFALATLASKDPAIDTGIRTGISLDLPRETGLLVFTPSTVRRGGTDITGVNIQTSSRPVLLGDVTSST